MTILFVYLQSKGITILVYFGVQEDHCTCMQDVYLLCLKMKLLLIIIIISIVVNYGNTCYCMYMYMYTCTVHVHVLRPV